MGINAAVNSLAREMVELLPAVLSRRHITAPGTALRPSPVVTLATATSMTAGEQRQLSARIWEEEAPPNLSAEYFCARLVIVNSDAFPVLARVTIASLPSEIATAWRMFHAVYVANLSKTVAGGSELIDMVDGYSANVYQLGCGQPPCSSNAGHCHATPATDDENIVQNGGFEEVESSRPTQLVSQTGTWHVYAPDGPGFDCVDKPPLFPGVENCVVSAANYTDDRARITADTSDPFEGRHSAKIIIPTRLPLVVPIPTVTPEAVRQGDRVVISLRARSSPPGVNLGLHSFALDPHVPTPLIKPVAGGTELLAEWTLVNSTVTVLGNSTHTLASTIKAGAFGNSEIFQLQLVSPYSTGCMVWIDDVRAAVVQQ